MEPRRVRNGRRRGRTRHTGVGGVAQGEVRLVGARDDAGVHAGREPGDERDFSRSDGLGIGDQEDVGAVYLDRALGTCGLAIVCTGEGVGGGVGAAGRGFYGGGGRAAGLGRYLEGAAGGDARGAVVGEGEGLTDVGEVGFTDKLGFRAFGRDTLPARDARTAVGGTPRACGTGRGRRLLGLGFALAAGRGGAVPPRGPAHRTWSRHAEELH